MKKRYILPLIGAAATVGVRYLIKNKNEDLAKTTTMNSYIQAGMPDQLDSRDRTQLENAKMVSEGSQYGVQYFNELAEDEMEELSKKISD
ncbi:hypothetical protein [Pseudogracilibacillus sp. SO30301A]|uniref:hypothetical protein n=1 Tax=Pseudogracilibacillus sp. SO30301A TaxID=3098291 RepID=UPI00300E4D2A